MAMGQTSTMIKKLFLALALLVLWPVVTFAQGYYYQNVSWSARGIPAGGATITVCSSAGTLIPTSTRLVAGCTPTVSIYTNAALTVSESNPFQADGLGNFHFFVAPGSYTYAITGPNVTSTLFSITVPIVIGAPFPVTDKGGQVFNVKAYGALGDGTANDSPAFQAAYNAAVSAGGGTVLVPSSSSCYLLSTAINMTSSPSVIQKVIIQGSTGGHGGVASGAADLICANTGGILFDVTGSDGIIFKDIAVTSQSGVTAPSLIGIYAARDSSNAGGQGIKIIDSVFDMVTHTSGTTYSFGAYLYGSEDDYFTRDNFSADYPLMVSGTNAFAQDSAFITEATGAQSETQDSFTDMELLSSGLGPFAYFNGTGNMTLTGHGWNTGQAASYPVALYGYALHILGGNTSMYVNFRQEGYPGFAYVAGSLNNSRIYGTHAPAASTPLYGIEFVDASTALQGDTFHIADEYSSASTNYYYDANLGSTTGVAIVDNVSFYCGLETNCVNIPIGNYATGGALYWKDVRWSGSGSNEYPVISFGGPVTGTFSIPATAVAATSCTALLTVNGTSAGRSASPVMVDMFPQGYYNLLLQGNPNGSQINIALCNPTSGSITPAAITGYWRVRQ